MCYNRKKKRKNRKILLTENGKTQNKMYFMISLQQWSKNVQSYVGSMLFSSWKERKKSVSGDCIQEIVPFIIFIFYTLYKKQMCYLITKFFNNIREFLCGPVARKLCFQWVQSLVREPRSQKPWSTVKINKQINKQC